MKLREGAKVIGAGVILSDEPILTVTDKGTAKLTPSSEFDPKGRGGAGVRITRFTNEKALVYASVGATEAMLAIVGSEADPSKPAPDPIQIELDLTNRDLVSSATDVVIIAVGQSRF